MAGSLRRLKRLLTDAGRTYVRPRSRRSRDLACPIARRHFTVDHGTKSRHTANETLKRAGLPKAF